MIKSEYNVRIPQITSVKKAIELYYNNSGLSNKNIEELFGKHSSATISRLKNVVRQKMIEKNTPVWNASLVNTKVAYEAWGLDIDDLEFRYQKMKALCD